MTTSTEYETQWGIYEPVSDEDLEAMAKFLNGQPAHAARELLQRRLEAQCWEIEQYDDSYDHYATKVVARYHSEEKARQRVMDMNQRSLDEINAKRKAEHKRRVREEKVDVAEHNALVAAGLRPGPQKEEREFVSPRLMTMEEFLSERWGTKVWVVRGEPEDFDD